MSEAVNHPSYYGGGDNPYEVIKVLEAWGLDKDFCLGNAVKYVARAGKKDSVKLVEDLEKAAWYLQRRISRLKDVTLKPQQQVIDAILKPCTGNISEGPHSSCAVVFGKEHCRCCCNTCVTAYRVKTGSPRQADPRCRECGQLLVAGNYWLTDGCPCNAPRGINHGLVPSDVCCCPVCDPQLTGSSRRATVLTDRADGPLKTDAYAVGEKPKASTDSTILKKRRTRDGFEVCKHDHFTKFHRPFNNPCACCGDAIVAPDPMFDGCCWACQDDPDKAQAAKKAMTGEKK